MRCRGPVGILALVLGAWAAVPAAPVRRAGPAEGSIVPGEVLVKFRRGASLAEAFAARSGLGARVRHTFRGGAERWALPPGVDVAEVVDRLSRDPRVQYAEPNRLVRIDLLPDDPLLPQMWALRNTGQTGGVPGADIDAERAWEIATGSASVRVAVIDTGIDLTHPDLAANLWTNPGEVAGNGLDDDGNGFPDDVHGYDFVNDDPSPQDDNGHGTHVAGIIGAVGNNAEGGTGVAWRVSLVAVKFLGSGGVGTEADAVAAIEYATDLGVDIMNNSWGGGAFSQTMLEAIRRADQAGILFVAAAGNSALDNDFIPHFPSSYEVPNVVSVAATEDLDGLASFSNFGDSTVHLGAPGVLVLSTLPGGYGLGSGTSMAAPHVAGAAALLKAIGPGLTHALIKERLLQTAEPVASLAGLTVTGGRLNAFTLIADSDLTPPGAVVDLTVAASFSTAIALTWRATGDDGGSGVAAAYDVRVSDEPLDESNLEGARIAAGAPEPAPAGSPETMEVGGLSSSTSYYFAVRALDEWGNAGPASFVSASTQPPPTLASSPDSFTVALPPGGVQEMTLTVGNAGQGTLDWRIVSSGAADTAVAPARSLVLEKGETDPREGAAVAAAAGGPDRFGYRFQDNHDPGGPAFTWVDISRTAGTSVPALTGDDQVSEPLPLGFLFPFYGRAYDAVRIGTNGWLSFTSAPASYTNQPLPSAAAPPLLVAGFWDDLDFGGEPRVTWKAGPGEMVVQFTEVGRYAGPGSYTFQIILRSTGDILFLYRTLEGDVASATVGIQDAAVDGLQVVFNADYLRPGTAVRIRPEASWWVAEPSSGRVPEGSSQEVAIRIQAGDLPAGRHQSAILLATNDPLRPLVPHPITLDVSGEPSLFVTPSVIDFGSVPVGLAATAGVAIANTGSAPLAVTSIAVSDPALAVIPTAMTVIPGETRHAEVAWSPSAEGTLDATLLIDSPGGPASIPIHGVAGPEGGLRLSPAAIHASLARQAATRTVTISNTSAAEIRAVIIPEPGAAPLPLGSDPVIGPIRLAKSGSSRLPPENEPSRALYPFLSPGGTIGRHAPYPPATAPPRLLRDQGDPSAAAAAAILSNPGFETGGFDGWLPLHIGGIPLARWAVTTAGRGWFGSTDPWEGSFDAHNGFDGEAGLRYALLRDIPLPPSLAAARLSYRDRIQFDSLGFQSSLPRVYQSSIQDLAGNVLAPITRQEIFLNGRAYTDLGWETRQVDLTPFAGRTVRLRIDQAVDESFRGPATIEFDDFRLDLAPMPAWLSASPAEVAIPAGGSAVLTVTLDAREAIPGLYRGALRIDGGAAGIVRLRAVLAASPAPDIAAPGDLDFGPAFFGTTVERSLPVVNRGSAALHAVLAIPEGPFRAPVDELTVPAGSSTDVKILYSPSSAADEALLRIAGDDDGDPGIVVLLRGSGIPPPVLSASLEPLMVTLRSGQSEMRPVTLTNNGGSPLTFSIAVRPIAAPGAAGAAACAPATALVSEFDAGALASIDLATGAVRRLASGLSAPNKGLSLSRDGDTAYVVESGRRRLTAVDLLSGALRPISSAGLSFPTGLAIREESRLAYVTDAVNNVLMRFRIDTGAAAPVGPVMSRPNGLAVTADGSRAYVVELDQGRLTQVDLLGPGVTTVVTGLSAPHDVVLDPSERIAFVSERDSGEISEVDLDTRTVTAIATGLLGPAGIALSPDALFVAEYGTGSLVKVDRSTGAVTPVASSLRGPAGVTLDGPCAAFASASPRSGTIPPGGSTLDVEVVLEASSLPEGRYEGALQVVSNDPSASRLEIPLTLDLIGAPHIVIAGEEVDLQSGAGFGVRGAATHHTLAPVLPPEGGALVELTAEGDFGSTTEMATLSAEGRVLGAAGGTGVDCFPATAVFSLSASEMAALSADAGIHFEVSNSGSVDPLCAMNRHTVRLTYEAVLARIDFGTVSTGSSHRRSIQLRNEGTAPLSVTAAVEGGPFAVEPAFLDLAPRAEATLAIRFQSASTGTFSGRLRLDSNDPDRSVIDLDLLGAAVEAPRLAVTPSRIERTLRDGETAEASIEVSNAGGAPLELALRAGGSGDEEVDRLHDSPAPLTCVVEDPASGAIYGQASGGPAFHRYDPHSGAWTDLAASPFPTRQKGGAALLHGQIFTAYVDEPDLLGVYTIATDSWATIANPLHEGTANIASDGARWIYLAAGGSFVRIDPATLQTEALTTPPFAFARGGLEHHQGLLFGHRGSGSVRFAAYDIATRFWITLPDLPAGAVLGSALDPVEGAYYTYGSSGGSQLYRYDFDAAAWSVRPVPFPITDGGLAWSSAPAPSLFLVQGGQGAGLARLRVPPRFLSVDPSTATIAPGGSASFTVHLSSAGLATGTYGADIAIASNDPARLEAAVPVIVHAVGAPRLIVQGEIVQVESIRHYETTGAITTHELPVPSPPGGPGTVQLTTEGSFSDLMQTASLEMEGTSLGALGGTSTCEPASAVFFVSQETLAGIQADAVARATVTNSAHVDTDLCFLDYHKVTLRYPLRADLLSFGEVQVGMAAELSIQIGNDGTDLLQASLSSSASPFTVSPAMLDLPPGSSARVTVRFQPAARGAVAASLRIASNDPGRPVREVPLAGLGFEPPKAVPQPASIEAAVPPRGSGQRALRLRNDGGQALTWRAALHLGPPRPAVQAAGGPDGGGYFFRDSGEPGGPPFAWEEIAETGTLSSLRLDDQTVGPIPLGMTFPFYDRSFTTVNICSNGFLSFTSSLATRSGQGRLPLPFAPENLVAPLWADLDLDETFKVHYRADGQRFIVQYSGVAVKNVPGSSLTFQVVLHASGRIEFRYLSVAGAVPGVTIGLQNGDRSIGLLVSGSSTYPRDGLAVEIRRLHWLTLDRMAGEIPPDSFADIALAFDADGLADGDHTARLAFITNDMARPLFDVPVVLHAGEVGVAHLAVDPAVLNAGSRGRWVSATIQLPAPLDPRDVVVPSVSIGGLVFADPDRVSILDTTGDGVPEILLKFDRASLLANLLPGQPLVEITGEVRDTTWFRGSVALTVMPRHAGARDELDGTADGGTRAGEGGE